MSHVRADIRARLVTLLTPVATTVRASRTLPLDPATLPAAIVYTADETIALDEAAFGTLERSLSVVVDLAAKAATEDLLDDALDELIVATEQAIAADPTLNGLAVYAVPASIAVTIDSSGALPLGRARVTYSVLYRTAPTVPTVSI